MKPQSLIVCFMFTLTSILCSSYITHAMGKSELQSFAEQGNVDAQYQLGEMLMDEAEACDAETRKTCYVESLLDSIMWFKIVSQRPLGGFSYSGAKTILEQMGRASEVFGDRLGLIQLVTNKLASNCIEKFYVRCGFRFDKNLFPANTVENIFLIMRRLKEQQR